MGAVSLESTSRGPAFSSALVTPILGSWMHRIPSSVPGTLSAHRWCPIPGPEPVPLLLRGPAVLWVLGSAPLPPGLAAAGSCSFPLGRWGEVTLQAIGPHGWSGEGAIALALADVIPGNHLALGTAFSLAACPPGCRFCPVLFVMWGGLREGLCALWEQVAVMPCLFSLRHLAGGGADWLQAQFPPLPPPCGRVTLPLCASGSSSPKRGNRASLARAVLRVTEVMAPSGTPVATVSIMEVAAMAVIFFFLHYSQN